MPNWSMGDAVAAGFRLIGREPAAFAAWVAVYAVVGLGPQALSTALSFSTFASLGAGAQPDPQALSAAMGPLQALQPLTIVAVILNAVLIYGAVFRGILFPDERRFGYLRIGARELWMILTMLALVGMFIAGMIAMAIPMFVVVGVGAVAAGAGGTAGAIGGTLVGIVFILGLFGVLIWVAMRMSLAMPTAFAEKRFPIPETWRQTKGHALRIFGVFALLYVLLIVAEIVLLGIGATVVMTVAPLAELGRVMQRNPLELLNRVNPAVWLAIAVVWSVFGAGFSTVIAAATAQIYKDLKGPDPSEVFA